MKKLFLFFAALISLIGISYAAEGSDVVDVNFCDGTNHLVTTLESGAQSSDICMNIVNKSNKKETIALFLVEREPSNEENKSLQICKSSPYGQFAKSVAFSGDQNVTLAPRESVEKHAVYSHVSGYAGELQGCIIYSVIDPDAERTNATMAIVTHKANLVDIIVPGEVISDFSFTPLYSLPGNESKMFEAYGKLIVNDEKAKIFYSRESHLFRAFVGIKNDGFSPEEYKMNMQFSTLLGLIKFHTEGDVMKLDAKSRGVALETYTLPWYYLFMNTDIEIMHRPVSFGDTQGEWLRLDYTSSCSVMPWQCAVALMIVITFLIASSRSLHKKKRKNESLQKETVMVSPIAQPKHETASTSVAPKKKVAAPRKKRVVTSESSTKQTPKKATVTKPKKAPAPKKKAS